MAVVNLQPQPPPPTSAGGRDYNMDYLKTPAGMLRIAEGVLALLALICTAEGQCMYDGGRFVYCMFILVLSMLEAILIAVIFVMRLEEKISIIDIPTTLLLNDGIALIVYFIACTLSLLAIGRCIYGIAARVIAALFIVALFLVLVGLNYLNYLIYEERTRNKELNKPTGMTITQSSPTVLT